MEENYYIRFDFQSARPNSSMKYYVLAKSIDDMNRFLSQHGFNDVHESLKIHDMRKGRSSDVFHVLQPYKFMSNHKPGVFEVMTCSDFVEHAIDNTANDLSDYSLFGEAILRQDIEFLKMIGELIVKLPHGFVIDYTLADESLLYKSFEEEGSSKGDIVEDIIEYRKRICSPSEDPGSRAVQQSLHDAVPDMSNDNNGIYPITIEAYVSSFTELMMDCYN